MVASGYIKETTHPKYKWRIYNYTPVAVHEGIWNEATRAARGLILDWNDTVLARPFPKFFNLGEEQDIELPDEDFIVYDKMDGSLGIIFHAEGHWNVATRGSFSSVQAEVGALILDNYYPHTNMDTSLTYLVEIIYPKNRIVIDYGTKEDIVFLGAINTKTGQEYLPGMITTSFPQVDTMSITGKTFSLNNIPDLPQFFNYRDGTKHEGFVVRFSSGYRIKVKIPDYKRIHRIVTNASNKTIWELMSTGQEIDILLEDVLPEDFKLWAIVIQDKLQNQFEDLHLLAHDKYEWQGDYKTTAIWIMASDFKYKWMLLAIMRKYDLSEGIWNIIRDDMIYERAYIVEEN